METQAQRYLEKAIQLYREGNVVGAAKALGQALDLNPALGHDAVAAKLATRLTGLDTLEALKLMRNVEKRGAFIHQNRPKHPKHLFNNLAIRIGVVVVVSSILSAIGALTKFQTDRAASVNSTTGQIERYTVAVDETARDYYVVTPNGEIPENGWPTLVVIHDVGQTGADMASAFQETAQANGVVVIAPTLTEIHADATEADYAAARRLLLVLLDEAQMLTFNNPRLYLSYQGQSYFGSGQGGGLCQLAGGPGLGLCRCRVCHQPAGGRGAGEWRAGLFCAL
ncbi:MAG TPA: hypothetical protein VHO69_19935, partial [Phototrophicaceae bacterium]|nr:hypothetical protein [Phototrophicaceae bacterium]